MKGDVWTIPVTYELTSEHAKKPTQATEGSGGWDLYAAEDFAVMPGEQYITNIHLKVNFSSDYAMFILPKSGLAAKHCISLTNSPALIDSDFPDEIKLILHNRHKTNTWVVKNGQKIAQAVFIKLATPVWTEGRVEQTTSRESGFGSTGK